MFQYRNSNLPDIILLFHPFILWLTEGFLKVSHNPEQNSLWQDLMSMYNMSTNKRRTKQKHVLIPEIIYKMVSFLWDKWNWKKPCHLYINGILLDKIRLNVKNEQSLIISMVMRLKIVNDISILLTLLWRNVVSYKELKVWKHINVQTMELIQWLVS